MPGFLSRLKIDWESREENNTTQYKHFIWGLKTVTRSSTVLSPKTTYFQYFMGLNSKQFIKYTLNENFLR